MEQLSHRDILEMMEPAGYLTDHHLGQYPELRFALRASRPRWTSEDKVPAVYAWVINADNASAEIIYLGKAGRGLAARCRQHEQGFKASVGKGKSNGDKLRNYMVTGRVELYAMWPEPASFRNILIPSHSAVEDWLLSAVARPPALNKEAAAKARVEAIAAGTHVPGRRKPDITL